MISKGHNYFLRRKESAALHSESVSMIEDVCCTLFAGGARLSSEQQDKKGTLNDQSAFFSILFIN